MNGASDPEREQALEDYKKSLLELREWEAKLKTLRMGIKDLQREFDVSEENIKALQSVGQIIGEVLKQLDEERCKSPTTVLKSMSAARPVTDHYSHRQGIIGTAVRRRLPFEG
jgi:ATP-dependent 26S proteasome regulatory subunit